MVEYVVLTRHMSSWDSHVLYESDDLNMAMAKFRDEVRAAGVAVDMSDTPDDPSAWRNIFRIELQKVSGKVHDFSRGMKAPQCFF